jgi:hypothetical protein
MQIHASEFASDVYRLQSELLVLRVFRKSERPDTIAKPFRLISALEHCTHLAHRIHDVLLDLPGYPAYPIAQDSRRCLPCVVRFGIG